MPTTNKSANVAKNSNYARSPLSLTNIIEFSREISYAVEHHPDYGSRSFQIEVMYDEYIADVEYTIEWECDLVTEFRGDRLYEWHKINEDTEVVNVCHEDGTLHPHMCYALNRIVNN